jgi:hypothetical protein
MASWSTGAARAATVRGLVTLPPEARNGEHEGHWRVENGILPIGPRVPDPRTEAVIVLEGGPAQKKSDDKPPSLTLSLHGLRLDPKVVIVPQGTTVNFKNDDRVPHTLYLENAAAMMPPEPAGVGSTRSVKLLTTAEYQVRDQEYPHIDGTVVVTDSPWTAAVDGSGQFKLDVPEGRYTLKVFFRGSWAVTMPVEVGPHTTDLKVDIPSRTGRAP